MEFHNRTSSHPTSRPSRSTAWRDWHINPPSPQSRMKEGIPETWQSPFKSYGKCHVACFIIVMFLSFTGAIMITCKFSMTV